MQHFSPQQQIQTITPTQGILRFRRVHVWVMFAVLVLNGAIALMLYERGGVLAAAPTLVSMSCLMLMLIWLKRMNKEAPQARPLLHLTPEGLTIEGVTHCGPIPWDAIQGITTISVLLVPSVALELADYGQLRQRLGPAGKGLWALRWGKNRIALNAVPFGGAESLAEQLRAYRDGIA